MKEQSRETTAKARASIKEANDRADATERSMHAARVAHQQLAADARETEAALRADLAAARDALAARDAAARIDQDRLRALVREVMELQGDRGERVAALEARLKVKSVDEYEAQLAHAEQERRRPRFQPSM